MVAPAAAGISLFEGFRLDRRGGVLFRRDQEGVFTPIAIGRRALDILGVLVERPGDLISRDEIIEAVWPGTTVEDSNLNVQIATLRRLLDNGRAEGSCIQTVSGRGYRFVAPVTRGEPAPPRRLTTILAADVASYSRLMGADEEGAYERLKAHLQQLVNPKIEEHHGRIVKNTGDGMLVEFASVVDAVRCAAEVQRGMLDREPDIPDERRIRFRIGINLGDVIVENDDIFGDGVNIAARLEALAEPGGICISRTVRDQIRDRLPYSLEDRGEQSVKNIARPVRVYALGPEAVGDLRVSGMPPTGVPQRQRTALARMLAAGVAVLVIALSAWWLWPTTKPSPTPTVVAATPISHPLVAPRMSIVVLPFANLNNDPEQQYFADAVTEDLTTDLSRLADMFVISRNTAFTYRNKPVDAKQIGRELGVRYILEGSVRRSGNQLRINAQLIDAETGAHLWAERFDRDTGDLFAVQNEITSRIAVAVGAELISADAARPTEQPDALDYILRGRAAGLKPASRDNYAERISLFERALALDPRSVEAQSGLAILLTARVMDGMTDTAAIATADIERAEGLAAQALAASPRSPYAHYARAQVLRVQGRCEEAIPEYETVVALNRNWVPAYSHIGRCKLLTGAIEEAIPFYERVLRLSPRDPEIANVYLRIGLAHLLQSHIDDAIVWLEKARSAMPTSPWHHSYLASAYALKGETERAAAELMEAQRLDGEGTYSSIARVRLEASLGQGRATRPKIRALLEATYYVGLRKAGMPEE
jgi:TolB-like protein/class 3 adenylate cyclase